MLATKCDLAEIFDDDVWYALICKRDLFLLDDIVALCLLLSLKFCTSMSMFFQLRYPQGYHL
jgi:hypothetical protein